MTTDAEINTDKSDTKKDYALYSNAERLTKILGAITALSVFFSAITGFISLYFRYLDFGIDFTAVANFEDYIRSSFTHLIIFIILFVFLLNNWFFSRKFILQCIEIFKSDLADGSKGYKQSYLIKFLAFLFISIISVLIIDFVYFSYTKIRGYAEEPKYQSDSWKSYLNHYGKSALGIKRGHSGIMVVEYSKEFKKHECLVFIGEVSGFYYYWSLIDESVVSFNKNAIVSFSTQLIRKPSLDAYSKLKFKINGEGTKQDFLDSPYGKKAIEWERKKEILCGNHKNKGVIKTP